MCTQVEEAGAVVLYVVLVPVGTEFPLCIFDAVHHPIALLLLLIVNAPVLLFLPLLAFLPQHICGLLQGRYNGFPCLLKVLLHGCNLPWRKLLQCEILIDPQTDIVIGPDTYILEDEFLVDLLALVIDLGGVDG